jgi:hypothetical protein
LARPLDRRQIIPMVQDRELFNEAQAVYEKWVTKPDKIAF